MKKALSTALAVFFLLAFASASWAGEIKDYMKALARTGAIIEKANQDTNNHYTELNDAGKERRVHEVTRGQAQGIIFDLLDLLDMPLYTITWGQTHGDSKNGQERYIGYTAKDEDFTNPAFPHDAWAGGVLEDRNWISEPWNDILGQQDNKYDNQHEYYKNLVSGMYLYYCDVIAGPAARPDFWQNLSSYIHILAPPTTWTWGMGRMWHRDSSGNVWYLTVPLPPGIMTDYLQDADVSVKIDPPEKEAKPGEEVTFTGTIKLKQAPAISIDGKTTAPGKWFVMAQAFHEVNNQGYPVTLEPLEGAPGFDNDYKAALLEEGKEYKYKLTVHAQNLSSKVKLSADPFAPFGDINPADNSAGARVKVKYINLGVKNLRIEPNPGVPGETSTAYGVAFNEYTEAFSDVPVILYVDKVYQGSTVVSLPAATQAGPGEVDFRIEFPTPGPGNHKIEVLINPARLAQTDAGRKRLDEWGLQVPDTSGMNVVPEGY